MDPKGRIYQGTEEKPVKPEDAARLDGFLKAKAAGDKERQMQARLEELEEKAA